jgi:predicted secreted Zn-dependent protease
MKKSKNNSLNTTKSKGSLKRKQEQEIPEVEENKDDHCCGHADTIEQKIQDMKPDKNMEQLQGVANSKLNSMSKSEIEQHHRIDIKYRNLEEYQFETQLRELVADCI